MDAVGFDVDILRDVEEQEDADETIDGESEVSEGTDDVVAAEVQEVVHEE